MQSVNSTENNFSKQNDDPPDNFGISEGSDATAEAASDANSGEALESKNTNDRAQISAQSSSNLTLLHLAKNGDKNAMDKLICGNMGLVKSVAVRFRDRGAEYEDLIQIGVIGMIKAVRSFDFSFNTAFSTYAVPLIIGEIRRFLRDDGIIKISRSVKKDGVNILRHKEEFMRINMREPTVNELAELCGIEAEELVFALEAVSPVHSLSEVIAGSDDDAMTIDSMISDRENAIDGLTDRIALTEAVKKLSELQQKIITLRYFRDFSQQKTGEILGLTQVKISREEKKIMEHLRMAL